MTTWDQLKANQVPTLAIVGDQDPLREGVDELKGKMGNVTIVLVKDADHASAFRRPEFLKAVHDFLSEHHGK